MRAHPRRASDGEFLRRVSLEVLSKGPSVAEGGARLARSVADKRPAMGPMCSQRRRSLSRHFAIFGGETDLANAQHTGLEARGCPANWKLGCGCGGFVVNTPYNEW